MSLGKYKPLSADSKENYGTNTVFESGQIETSNEELKIIHDIDEKPKRKKAFKFSGNVITDKQIVRENLKHYLGGTLSDMQTQDYKLVDIILIRFDWELYRSFFSEPFFPEQYAFPIKVEYPDMDDVEFKGFLFYNKVFFRILCGAKNDTPNMYPVNIKFTDNTGKEMVIDADGKSEEIKEDMYEFYKEQIKIYSSTTFPHEKTCDLLAQVIYEKYHKKDFLYKCLQNKDIQLPDKEYNACERNMQVYYCSTTKTVYGVDTQTVRDSKIFAYHPNVEEEKTTGHVMPYDYGVMKYLLLAETPFNYQNITNLLWIARRYNHIKDVGLHGQDNEFNIFRALCFCRYDIIKRGGPHNIFRPLYSFLYGNEYENYEIRWQSQIVFKFATGVICLILQMFLTIGIVMELINNWDIDEMFDKDTMIISISFMVFTFISFLFTKTVKKFWEWYENMHHVMQIAWYIKLCDFVSNILIGFALCLVSFFYLLQSETIGDVVLNSFALTFVIELDDLANIWEADEDVLLFDDFYISTDKGAVVEFWIPSTRRRRIYIAPHIFCISIGLILISPLFIFVAMFGIMCIVYSHMVQMIKGYPTIY